MTEKREREPAAMNAFELISMSKALNLENLFDPEQVRLLESDFEGVDFSCTFAF